MVSQKIQKRSKDKNHIVSLTPLLSQHLSQNQREEGLSWILCLLRYLLVCQLKSSMQVWPHCDMWDKNRWGKLVEVEDTRDGQMSDIMATYRDGLVAQLDQVYTRGSKICFLILYNMLKKCTNVREWKIETKAWGHWKLLF
jgi:hypothetical protein